MPRNKGSKNKPKTDDELIKQLAERGYLVSKVEGKTNEDDETPPAPKEKVNLQIDKPKIPDEKQQQPQQQNGQVLKCGNRLCNKVLDKEYGECPFCGVKLTWQ